MYNISLPIFQGPFDLLLFFIERDEIDIHNIPIATITNDFLDYIRQLEKMNLDIASEFILVAATLMRIKAKMLLPRKELDETGAEIDPRKELVDRLMEYKKYKAVLEELQEMESDRLAREKRGYIGVELKILAVKALADADLESVSIYKLLKVYQKIMAQYEERQKNVHKIANYQYTVEEQRIYLKTILQKKTSLSFEEVFTSLENKIHAIVTFLAVLELIQLQTIEITVGIGFNNFWLSLKYAK